VRILFSFIGGTGHFMPLVPLARAAERAGHTVAVAGAGGQVPVVSAAGFTPYATSDPPAAGPLSRGDGPPEVSGRVEAELEFAENFASKGAMRHASVLPGIMEDFGPDLVVRDEADLGVVIAAEQLRVPTVSVLVLAAGSLIRPELVGPRLREVRVARGLPPDPPGGRREPVLSPFPATLRSPEALPALIDVAFRAGDPVPVRDQGSPPTVFVTLGTSFGVGSGDLLDRLLAGLADVQASVVVALGRRLDPADLGPQPAHVALERFVDQDAVLGRTDLVISHGGSGTLLGALAHGLPQVLVPLGADQPHNADRVEALGLGQVLDAATASPAEIRRATQETLLDPVTRDRAQALQTEINELASVDETVSLMERSA